MWSLIRPSSWLCFQPNTHPFSFYSLFLSNTCKCIGQMNSFCAVFVSGMLFCTWLVYKLFLLSICSSAKPALTLSTPGGGQSLFSLHSHEDLLFVTVWHNNYSDRCEMISHGNFDCISLMISNVRQLFMSLLAIYMFPWKNIPSVPLLIFFNCIACLFDVELYEFFVYFGYQPIIRYIVYK